MKTMRKISAFIMALVVLSSLTVGVMADNTAKPKEQVLKLENAYVTHNYDVYQILTGDLSTNDAGEYVLSNSVWGAGVTEAYQGNWANANEFAASLNDGNILEKSREIGKNLKDVHLTLNQGNDFQATVDSGYYFIKDRDEAIEEGDAYTAFIVEVAGSECVASLKAEKPSSDKKVFEYTKSDEYVDPALFTTIGDSHWKLAADYEIGDEVHFMLHGKPAKNAANFVGPYKFNFRDTLSPSLDFIETSVVVKMVKGGVESTLPATAYTVDATPNNGATNIAIKFDDLKQAPVSVTEDTELYVFLAARLNDKAKLEPEKISGAQYDVDNLNKLYVEYSKDPNWDPADHPGEDVPTNNTPESTVIVYTYGLVISKVDKDMHTLLLQGAEFDLERKQKKSDGTEEWVKVNTDPITSDIVGNKIKYFHKGIQSGEYRIIETKAPVGYNLLEQPVPFKLTITLGDDGYESGVVEPNPPFEWEETTGHVLVTIENGKGATLPETGGMGTTLFYIFGGVFVVGSAILLVTRKIVGAAK